MRVFSEQTDTNHKDEWHGEMDSLMMRDGWMRDGCDA